MPFNVCFKTYFNCLKASLLNKEKHYECLIDSMKFEAAEQNNPK